MQFIFIVCQVEGYPIMLKLSCRLRAFASCTTFNKISTCLILCIIFEEKYFFCYVLTTDQLYCLVDFTLREIWKYVNSIVC